MQRTHNRNQRPIRSGDTRRMATAATASPRLRSPDKPLDRMDRLADMAHFPALVNAGATANVLVTITVTWFVASRFPQPFAPLLWVAIVLALNLAPVVLLRALSSRTRPMPRLRDMDFVHDQHRFSDWVYLAASANMAFWILVSWAVFSSTGSTRALALMLAIAFLATFSPVLLRVARRRAD